MMFSRLGSKNTVVPTGNRKVTLRSCPRYKASSGTLKYSLNRSVSPVCSVLKSNRCARCLASAWLRPLAECFNSKWAVLSLVRSMLKRTFSTLNWSSSISNKNPVDSSNISASRTREFP